jgi:PAT family beta-lactamase induction signal transducer AmpG
MKILTILTNIRFFKIFILGITSGMPFAILYTTIIAWLNDFNLDFKTVTLLATARTPYSLKFLWSPIMDYYSIPILGNLLGKRRSWMLLSSMVIASILYYLSTITPTSVSFHHLWFMSVIIGFCAATYDIAYDALRIEMLQKDEQALGVAHTTLAFRIGIILTGAVALGCVDHYGWRITFLYLTWLFIIGSLLSVLIKTQINPENIAPQQQHVTINSFWRSTKESFIDVIGQKYSLIILSIIVIYKLGDAMLAFVGMKFYTVVGFSLTEISFVVKTCGLIATIAGSYAGALIVNRVGQLKGLITCGIMQMATNLGYIWLHHAGHDINVFLITNICENFTGGMGAAALGGYISSLCNIKFAANQFALLSSCATFMNNTLTATSGKLVEQMGWDMYFVFTTVISVPSLFMIHFLEKKLQSTRGV